MKIDDKKVLWNWHLLGAKDPADGEDASFKKDLPNIAGKMASDCDGDGDADGDDESRRLTSLSDTDL